MARRGKTGAGKFPDVRSLARMVKSNWLMYAMAALIIVGMTVGAVLARNGECLSYQGVSMIVKEYTSQRDLQTFWQCFISSLEAILPFFAVLFLSGLSVLGAICVPFVMFFRGLGLGLILGYLYGTFGWQGVGYSLLLILPYGFAASVALMFAAREGIRFSFRLTSQMMPSTKPSSMWPSFRLFCIRCLIIFIVLCIASFFDSVLAVLCNGFFTLSY